MKVGTFDTTAARSANMRKIRSKETEPEVLLRGALWSAGIRYRKNYRGAAGTPDIAILSARVAVFVDGAFWHGYEWEQKRERIVSNRDYWVQKIERNMARDRAVDAALSEAGWLVLRFWDFEVKDDLDGCVRTVLEAVGRRGRSLTVPGASS